MEGEGHSTIQAPQVISENKINILYNTAHNNGGEELYSTRATLPMFLLPTLKQ